MKQYLLAAALFFSCSLFGAYRVVPVSPTPESNSVVLSIVFPKERENYSSGKVRSQMRLRGYPLGVISSFERARVLREDKRGQTIHVLIDNNPYFSVDRSALYNYDQQRAFYDNVLNFQVPYFLPAGEHVIRAFPVRSYGESIKDDEAFAVRVFYVQDSNKQNKIGFDETAPMLTYNEPQGTFTVSANDPVLLDFYVSHCELSESGYKVRLSINGKQIALLARWMPYYIYGFPKGAHTVTLELIDKNGKSVPGPFNKTTRTVAIQ